MKSDLIIIINFKSAKLRTCSLWNPISTSMVSLLKLLHNYDAFNNNIIKYDDDCEPPQVIDWEQEGEPHIVHQYMMVCLIVMVVLVIPCDKPLIVLKEHY